MKDLVSVIIPVYNVEKYISEALKSVLIQTYKNLEVIIVDDGSPDKSISICEGILASSPEIDFKIISQENRGLAEARNTGIKHASGQYLSFIDGDDIWLPEKLEKHVKHLNDSPQVGVSFSRSEFIDETGASLNSYQMPRLSNITPEYALRCNPIGNGSAAVFRREVFDAIAFEYADGGTAYFDKEFKVSQDIECWLRILIQTPWEIKGVSEPLTLYRINPTALSANLEKRVVYWEKLFEKVSIYAPELIDKSGDIAMAYRLKSLARESVRRCDSDLAIKMIHRSAKMYPWILLKDPKSFFTILMAAYSLAFLPRNFYNSLQFSARSMIGRMQDFQIRKSKQS